MSFYGGGNQSAGPAPGQRTSVQSHNMPGSQSNPVDVMPSQIFNFAPNQLQFQAAATGAHNISFPDPSSQIQMQNTIQLAASGAQQLLLHQQQQSFSNLNVNFLTDQIGVGQILQQQQQGGQNAQIPVQNLITPISVALTGVSFAQPIQGQPATSQASPQAKQKVFTGTVTKTHDNFGFIDEEVFFQMSVVKGVVLPKPGDRVLVEADYNPSMPFKWNATRVQIVNIGGLNNNLPNMNLNPGGKPPSPQPMSHGSQQASHLSQHSSASGGTNLLNLNFNQQNHNNSQKNNQPNQNPGVLSNTPHGQNQSQPQGGQRYAPGGNPVSIVSNPHSAYSIRNSSVRVEENARGLGAPRPMRTRPPPPNMSGQGPMMSLSSMVDPHSGQHIQLPIPLQLPLSMPLQIPSLLQLDQRDRDADKMERDRELRERDRERDRDRDRERQEREREKEQDRRDRERERDRSLEREKEREKEREREYERKRDRERERDREKQKRIKDDIKREREKERERDKRESPSRAPRARSPMPLLRDSRKRSRSRSKGRERDKDIRERSKSRSNSPKRVSAPLRPLPRYSWELPKAPFDMMDVGVCELKRRFRNLYIPSDFIMAKCVWQETFPLHKSLDLSHSCPVHIFRRHTEKMDLKEVCSKPKFKDSHAIPSILNPPDESDTLKVKVVLMALPTKSTLYRKSCGLAEESPDGSLQHPSRLINFVVGTKMAKNEAMLVGGSWSPSLDGRSPESNPQVLINTAIRTTKALLGLDLRRCTKWYRFMEMYYRRGNGAIETVVVLLPNIWAALPSRKEWEEIQRSFKDAFAGDLREAHGSVEDSNVVPSTSENSPNRRESRDSEERREDTETAAGSTVTIPVPADSSGEQRMDIDEPKHTDDVTKQAETRSPVMKMEVTAEESQVEIKQELGTKTEEEVDIYGDLFPSLTPSEKADLGNEDRALTTSATSGVGVNGTNATVVKEEVVDKDLDEDGTLQSNTGEGKEQHVLEALEAIVEQTTVEEDSDSERIGTTQWSMSDLRALKVVELKDLLHSYGKGSGDMKGLRKNDLVNLMAQQIKESCDSIKPIDECFKENSTTVQSEEVQIPQSNGTEGKNENRETAGQEGIGNNMAVSKPDPAVQDATVAQPVVETHVDIPNETAPEEPKSMGASKVKRVGLTYQVPVLPLDTNEKTRKVWERRYALPKSPSLLIHPSAEAKSGIFDCNVHSLHLLRDYRLTDNKEQSFEVSLCSEFFHEMLQRDFAFRIYRELVYQASLNSQDEKDEKVSGPVLPKEESPAKKRKISTSGSVTSGSGTKSKTEDPFLLLAFTYFDHTRCGYVTEADLEELCLSFGFGLSRSQVRKLVQKVCTKGNLYYRKWTDVSCEDGVTSSRPPRNDCSEENLLHLANGNKSLLPTYGKPRLELQDIILHPADGENLKKETESLLAACDSDSSSVDSKQLRDQLEKSEKDRAVLEANLNLVKNSLTDGRVQMLELKNSNDTLKEELGRTKDLLKKAENSEATAQSELEVLKKAAERFFDRVKDVVKLRSSAQGCQDG